MKKIVLTAIVIALAIATTSCNKPNEVFVTKIEAKVENASKYSNVVEVILMWYDGSIYKNIELARGEWKDGGFTMVLPQTLNPNYLHALNNNNGDHMTIINPPSTVSINNKSVKVLQARFLGVDKDGNAVTRFYPLKIDKNGDDQDAFFTYVDSDVTISGYTKRRNASLCHTEYDNERYTGVDLVIAEWREITTTYSIKWKKGWNVWFFSRFGDMRRDTATEKWASTPVSKLKWFGAEDLWIGNREQMLNH